MTTSVMWFRRDLRLSDNLALLAAQREADEVVPLFVLDQNLLGPAGPARIAFLYQCLRSLNEQLDGMLVVRSGDPSEVLTRVVGEAEASRVFCTEDFGPYGRRRDDAVELALLERGCTLERVDSAYAVEPGSVVKSDGTPYKVFGAYNRAWVAHGWGRPVSAVRSPRWMHLDSEAIPDDPDVSSSLPSAGEKAALRRASSFIEKRAEQYASSRDFPAAGGTSRLSPYLKYGCVHPRQLLHRLGSGPGPNTFRTELCWRDFYADVLFHNPGSVDRSLVEKMAAMKVDNGKRADERFEAWAHGETGYPIVDAGMRQLQSEAWMHNRVRMIVASFLVKDLHIDWHRGARWFMQHLVDGDLASNTHGWQWVAGTGTDAAPYFRIFNPITQGKKFDPDGIYIKKWVPQLRDLDVKGVHEPWKSAPGGYPAPIVDHDEERREALRRYAALGS